MNAHNMIVSAGVACRSLQILEAYTRGCLFDTFYSSSESFGRFPSSESSSRGLPE
jgi:hypothetical protein